MDGVPKNQIEHPVRRSPIINLSGGCNNRKLYFSLRSHYASAVSVRRVGDMIQDGEYAAWSKTPRGEGTGIVTLANGEITGGDSVLSYSGWYKAEDDRFTAVLTTRRHTAGQPTVFGIDEVELRLAGKSAGVTASCTGTATQAPDLPFQATLIRIQTTQAPSIAPAQKSGSAGVLVDLQRHGVLHAAGKARL
jgi:hypothetical protein